MTATEKPDSLAGVVLAAGASPWQGRAKAMKQVAGARTTAVEYVVGILEKHCAPVFVVTAPGQSLPDVAAQVVRDDVRGHGQLSAIGRGLRAAAEAGVEYAFLCAVDAQVLSGGVIDELASRAAASDADVVLPWDGENHYFSAVYRTGLSSAIDELVAAGERDVLALIARVDSQRIVIADSDRPVDTARA